MNKTTYEDPLFIVEKKDKTILNIVISNYNSASVAIKKIIITHHLNDIKEAIGIRIDGFSLTSKIPILKKSSFNKVRKLLNSYLQNLTTIYFNSIKSQFEITNFEYGYNLLEWICRIMGLITLIYEKLQGHELQNLFDPLYHIREIIEYPRIFNGDNIIQNYILKEYDNCHNFWLNAKYSSPFYEAWNSFIVRLAGYRKNNLWKVGDVEGALKSLNTQLARSQFSLMMKKIWMFCEGEFIDKINKLNKTKSWRFINLFPLCKKVFCRIDFDYWNKGFFLIYEDKSTVLSNLPFDIIWYISNIVKDLYNSSNNI